MSPCVLFPLIRLKQSLFVGLSMVLFTLYTRAIGSHRYALGLNALVMSQTVRLIIH